MMPKRAKKILKSLISFISSKNECTWSFLALENKSKNQEDHITHNRLSKSFFKEWVFSIKLLLSKCDLYRIKSLLSIRVPFSINLYWHIEIQWCIKKLRKSFFEIMIFQTKMKRTLHFNVGFYWFIHFQNELYEKYTKMDLRNEKKAVFFFTILLNAFLIKFG